MSTSIRIAWLGTRVLTQSIHLGTWLNSLLLNSLLCKSRNMAPCSYNWLWVTILTSSREFLFREQVRLRLFIKTFNWILIQFACALIKRRIPINSIVAVTVPRLSNRSFLWASFSAPRHIVKNHGFFGNLIFKGQSCTIGSSFHLLWVIYTMQFGSERDSNWVSAWFCTSYCVSSSFLLLPRLH